MIILIFLFISCSKTSKIESFTEKNTSITFFHSYQNTSWTSALSTANKQEEAQLYLLRGLYTNNVDDYILSRSLGFSCMQESQNISFFQEHHLSKIDWTFDYTQKKECLSEHISSILPIPKEEEYIACVTWTLLSWAKLLQWYHLDRVMIDEKMMFLLSAWLFEQKECLDSPWVNFAIAVGFLQSHLDQMDSEQEKEQEQYAVMLIQDLWNHPYIGQYVKIWYIRHRLQKGAYLQKEVLFWKQAIQEIQAPGKEVLYLQKHLERR